MTTRTSAKLTLKDKLSRLTHQQAIKLLGPDGARRLTRGGARDIEIEQQVRLTPNSFRLELFVPQHSFVTISLSDGAQQRLSCSCSTCDGPCDDIAAALALILEEKTMLGLAVAPDTPLSRQAMSHHEIDALEVVAREKRAKSERMTVRSMDVSRPWTDYQVTNKASGKTYRVALRGREPGQSFCSCPDFRKNTLGVCKHTIHVMNKVAKRFTAAQLRRPFRLKNIIVYLQYGKEVQLFIGLPDKLASEAEKLITRYRKRPQIKDIPALLKTVARLESAGYTVTIYPDAEKNIQQSCWQAGVRSRVEQIRKAPAKHPLRKTLLKAELLPYQLDGIAFAVGAGRAILADDMGLGKTIQGIGAAALLRHEADISKTLVVCPASLKAQWRAEIHNFSDFDCQLIAGAASTRAEQYDNDCFITVCNYEQVLRDLAAIELVQWDLIILDEGQRIKNWEAKTTNVIKSLCSPFALVLSGTPLENRIDELYSIVEFIDDRRLGPDFRFYQRHRVMDEKGKVIGYEKLDELRENLKPVLLRRTRASVLGELPPRTNEIVRLEPTEEQVEMHAAHMRTVSSIINKPYLSEMDLLRLQKALLMCRMSADSTTLVDKVQPGHSSKLLALADLFDRIFRDKSRKVVLFSEWTGMLNLIEPLLKKRNIAFARLDGSVPQKKRPILVSQFMNDEQCRLFMTTNAGSTGLNLQFANTVINVDLPWTPALLEQRIGRVHRMGQKQAVHAFVLVTESTIEESLLATLSAKHELALAVLDPDSDVDTVNLVSGIEALKQKLEVLLGAQPEAPVDESMQRNTQKESVGIVEQQRLSEAGGQLLGAALNFLSEALPVAEEDEKTRAVVSDLKQRFTQSISLDSEGKPQLTVTLPDTAALDKLAESLARLLVK